MRRSELVALTLLDVVEKPDGLLVTIRRSRPTRTGTARASPSPAAGTTPPTPSPPSPPGASCAATTPARCSPACSTPGSACTPLSGYAIARMLRTRAHAAGLDAGRITAHSLRAGHATTAARRGVPLARIAAQTRHQDVSVLVNRYIRPLEALSTTSSRDLGP